MVVVTNWMTSRIVKKIPICFVKTMTTKQVEESLYPDARLFTSSCFSLVVFALTQTSLFVAIEFLLFTFYFELMIFAPARILFCQLDICLNICLFALLQSNDGESCCLLAIIFA